MYFVPKTETAKKAMEIWNHSPLLKKFNLENPDDARRFYIIKDGKPVTPFWNEEAERNYDPVNNPCPHLNLLEQNFTNELFMETKVYVYDDKNMPELVKYEGDRNRFVPYGDMSEEVKKIFGSPEQKELIVKQQNRRKITNFTSTYANTYEYDMETYRAIYGRVRKTKAEVEAIPVKDRTYAEKQMYSSFGSIKAEDTFDLNAIDPLTDEQFVYLAVAGAATGDVSLRKDHQNEESTYKLSLVTDTIAVLRRSNFGEHEKVERARTLAKNAAFALHQGNAEPAGKLIANALKNMSVDLRKDMLDHNKLFETINTTNIATLLIARGLLEMMDQNPGLRTAAVNAGLDENTLSIVRAQDRMYSMDQKKMQTLKEIGESATLTVAEAKAKLADVITDYTIMQVCNAQAGVSEKNDIEEFETMSKPLLAEHTKMLDKKYSPEQFVERRAEMSEYHGELAITMEMPIKLKRPVLEFEKKLGDDQKFRAYRERLLNNTAFRKNVESAFDKCTDMDQIRALITDGAIKETAKNSELFAEEVLKMSDGPEAAAEPLQRAEPSPVRDVQKPAHTADPLITDEAFLQIMDAVNYRAAAEHPETLTVTARATEADKYFDEKVKHLSYLHTYTAAEHFGISPLTFLNLFGLAQMNAEQVTGLLKDKDVRVKELLNDPDAAAKVRCLYDAFTRDRECMELISSLKKPMLERVELPVMSAEMHAALREDQFLHDYPLAAGISSTPADKARLNQKRVRAREILMEQAAENSDGYSYSGANRWAKVLQKKPGLSEQEKEELRTLNTENREDKVKLALRYLDELASVEESEYRAFSFEEYTGKDYAKHEYYGHLAWDTTMMLSDLKTISYPDMDTELKEQLEIFRKQANALCGPRNAAEGETVILLSPVSEVIDPDTVTAENYAFISAEYLMRNDDNAGKDYMGRVSGFINGRDGVEGAMETARADRPKFIEAVNQMKMHIRQKLAALEDQRDHTAEQVHFTAQPSSEVYDKWFTSFEWAMKNAGYDIHNPLILANILVDQKKTVDPAFDYAVMNPSTPDKLEELKDSSTYAFMETDNDGKYKKERPEKYDGTWLKKNMKNFGSASSDMKKHLFEMAKQNRLYIPSLNKADGPQLITVKNDGTAAIAPSVKELSAWLDGDQVNGKNPSEYGLTREDVRNAQISEFRKERLEQAEAQAEKALRGHLRTYLKSYEKKKDQKSLDQIEAVNAILLDHGEYYEHKLAEVSMKNPSLLATQKDVERYRNYLLVERMNPEQRTPKEKEFLKNHAEEFADVNIHVRQEKVPDGSALNNERLNEYRIELNRLKKEMEKAGSIFSHDTESTKNLHAELNSCEKYLNQKSEEGNYVNLDYRKVRSALNAVNSCCRNYIEEHKNIADLSDRQVLRLKTMHKLMSLNERLNAVQPVHTNDLKRELAEKIALGYAVRTQSLKGNAKGVQKYLDGHKCLLNHHDMKSVTDKLMENESFESFVKLNHGKMAALLKTNGVHVSKQFDSFTKELKGVTEDIKKNVIRGLGR